MVDPSELRVIHIGPAAECGGVGSHTQRFADALAEHVGQVVPIRHGGPGSDSVAALRRRRTELLELLAADERPTVVHAELSGGSVESFWPTAGVERQLRRAHRAPLISATVHDPPGLVWWPGRTRFLAGRRVLSHGSHFPLRPVTRRAERAVFGRRILFATSHIGADSLRTRYPDATVHTTMLAARAMPSMPPVIQRPRAVGLFGLVYRGKGFEHIEALRERLPDDITIRIAGRGTEDLPTRPGIEVLGGLDEEALVGFFASIRILVVPYGNRSAYGAAYPGSSVVTDAISYLTPVVTTGHGALAELAAEGGVALIDSDSDSGSVGGPADLPAALAQRTTEIIDDDARLAEMGESLAAMRKIRAPEEIIGSYVSAWSR